jgi:hypothetical protein
MTAETSDRDSARAYTRTSATEPANSDPPSAVSAPLHPTLTTPLPLEGRLKVEIVDRTGAPSK